MRPLDVAACRAAFPALAREHRGRPVVYLDGPAGSQVPATVADEVRDVLLHHNANLGGAFDTALEVVRIVEDARRAAADLLGTDDPETVAFGPNMTTLTFALSRAVGSTLRPGDEVVVTRLDHDANVTPWVLAAEGAGATVRKVPIRPDDCTLDLDALDAAIGPRARLVAVGAASNAVGTINPVAPIADMAHAVGAKLFVDAVHHAPHALMDVEAWGADWVSFSAYKIFGPHVGVLWGRRELMEGTPAFKVRPAPDTTPDRWMTGTPAFELLAGVTAAVGYLASLADPRETDRRSALIASFQMIRAHERELASRLLEGISSLGGYRVLGIADPARLAERHPTVSVVHTEHSPRALHERLAAEGIYTWAGHHYALELSESLGLEPDGMLRLGLLHYNTAEEVDRTIEALDRATR